MIAEQSVTPNTERRPSPYVGLSFYTENDTRLFFGRDAERQVIMGNLRASRLTLLYGQSGVGKSSLLRAGVAARLGELAQQVFHEGGSSCYVPVVFSSWKDDSLAELVAHIEAVSNSLLEPGQQVELPRHSLRLAIEAAVSALAQGAAREGSDRPAVRLLIMLDQFEEYFVYGGRDSHGWVLADQIAECVASAGVQANFLISVREDAYAAVGDLLKGRVSNVYGNYLHLEFLDAEAAREAIEKPIEQFNVDHDDAEPIAIEPGLVDAVLAQVSRAPGEDGQGSDGARPRLGGKRPGAEIVTPYLQLVMTTLWEHEVSRGSRTLRLATLEELHGAARIVARHLDAALSGFDPMERELAVDVLHHLVTPSGTKIALEIGDLATYTRQPAETVTEVLTQLAGPARIVREVPPAPGNPAEGAFRRFEIYHDVLAGPINEAVSRSAVRRLEREKRAADERARRERKRARTFRALAAGAGALLLLAIAAAIVAIVQTGHAHEAKDAALSRQLSVEAESELEAGDRSRGVLLSLEAYRAANTAAARGGLMSSLFSTKGELAYLSGHAGAVNGVAFSSDGTRLASASADRTVAVWDTLSWRRLVVLRAGTELNGVAFSPNGRMLAAAGQDGTITLWNANTGVRLGVLPSDGSAVESVAFSSDGSVLASGSKDGAVTLWDRTTGRRVRTLSSGEEAANSVAFSPDGTRLAAGGGNGTVVVWEVRTGRRLFTLRMHKGAVNSVAFSPKGETLASASSDRTVIVWSLRTGHALSVLHGTAEVESVAFSPGGRLLASGAGDGTATLWDTQTGRRLGVLSGQKEQVSTVAFSPDGRTLATGNLDHSVIVWATPANVVRTLVGHTAEVQGVAYSPDGKLLASASKDRTVVLWSTLTGQRLRTLRGHADEVESVAFSPDGHTLASAGLDGRVILWDVATGTRFRVLRGHGKVYSVSFSPDGSLLGSANADGTTTLWDVASGRRLRSFGGHNGEVNRIAFSPDGKILASGGQDGWVIMWNVSTGAQVRKLGDGSSPIYAVAFSPDGKTLASASQDGRIILWSAPNWTQLGDPLIETDAVNAVAFSPSGSQLASGGEAGATVVWNLRTRLGGIVSTQTPWVRSVAFDPSGQIIASGSDDGSVQLARLQPDIGVPDAIEKRLCAIANRNLTPAEWRQFLPGEPYAATCGRQP
jgi:WD40 repeat protein